MKILGAGLALSLLATIALAGDGAWRNIAAGDDIARAEARDEALAKAMNEAQAGAPADRAALEAAMSGGGEAIGPGAVMGEWRCRTIKLGGLVPLIVYDWFRCRFSTKNGQTFFEKLSGSQRISGYVYEDGAARMILLGALSVANEPQGIYAGAGESAGGEVAQSNQIGILVRAGAGRMRIEFPYPHYESTFDVLELVR